MCLIYGNPRFYTLRPFKKIKIGYTNLVQMHVAGSLSQDHWSRSVPRPPVPQIHNFIFQLDLRAAHVRFNYFSSKFQSDPRIDTEVIKKKVGA